MYYIFKLITHIQSPLNELEKHYIVLTFLGRDFFISRNALFVGFYGM